MGRLNLNLRFYDYYFLFLVAIIILKGAHSFVSSLHKENCPSKCCEEGTIKGQITKNHFSKSIFSSENPSRIFSSPIIEGNPPPDPIEYVSLLGKLTPNPSIEDEGGFDFENAIKKAGDSAVNPNFVKWLQEKVELNESLGNQAAMDTLGKVLAGIAATITKRLEPATNLIIQLAESETDCEKVRLLRQNIILPGGEKHPYYQEPKEGEMPASVDPMEFKVAYDVIMQQVIAEDSPESLNVDALESVIEMTKRVLNGEPIEE